MAVRSWFIAVLLVLGLAGTLAAAPIKSENPAGGMIRHHSLHAAIDPATAGIEVSDTLTIVHRPNVPASRSFPFLLARSLKLGKVAGIGCQVAATEGTLKPREYWDDPPYDELEGYEAARSIGIAPAQLDGTWPESIRVVVEYAGAIYDSLRPPKAAYSRGFESTSGLIDPRGAYLNYASFWIPTRPDERFTFRCTLGTPPDWHGISQGALAATAHSPEGRVNIWDSPQPMEEIYLVAGPYTMRSEPRAGVQVMTFTYANTDEALCKRYIDGTERYLKLYGSMIGPYPFDKFALVENFWQTGFGMPSFTLLGDTVVRLPFILDTSYGHEILHNWWGKGVFVDYRKGNWCEGLTAYGADYLYKEMQSAADARDYRRTTLQGYLDYVSGNEDAPLRQFLERSDFATQAIGYGKSLMVFHQIRRLLGDEEFWKSLQDFYRGNLFRRASWDDLFSVFSAHAGRDLNGWKEQWLDRTGAPGLVLKNENVEKRGGIWRTEVVIGQKGDALYDLRVPVRIGRSDGGAESTQVVALTGPEASCSFESVKRPDWIAVDPDFDVLRRIDPSEIPAGISRTLGADTAVVVIASGLSPEMTEAYRALAVEWGGGAKLAIADEDQLDRSALLDLPTWYFGLGETAFRQMATLDDAVRATDGAWSINGEKFEPGHAVVLAGGAPPRSWTILDASSPGQLAAVGRKIPHYGKYGYLVFKEATNVAKGSWTIRTSPLLVRLDDAEKKGQE